MATKKKEGKRKSCATYLSFTFIRGFIYKKGCSSWKSVRAKRRNTHHGFPPRSLLRNACKVCAELKWGRIRWAGRGRRGRDHPACLLAFGPVDPLRSTPILFLLSLLLHLSVVVTERNLETTVRCQFRKRNQYLVYQRVSLFALSTFELLL